jgi:sulfhydrogenase subunit alpha
MTRETINVPALARVEGEGGLFIGLKDGSVAEIRLDIYEPPRFFEGFLRGRFLQEVPDITARICGICPVAYQMSAAYALEKALDIKITPQTRLLRRLFYCGEYIESHTLHIYLLQAPDMLGQESALSLAAVDPDVVKRALRLKKIGNEILRTIGGRSVHPVSVCVGGFYKWTDPAALQALLPELEWAFEASKETARWAASLPYPKLEVDYEFVATYMPDEYAIIEGDVISNKRGQKPIEEFDSLYLEEHVERSNALHSRTKDGQTYLVGPLARFNLNHEQLGPAAKALIKELKIKFPLRNPYKSLLARAIEVVQACEEAIALIKAYKPEGPSAVPLTLKAGEGCAATEAPRGLLFHRYKVNSEGLIEQARIVPPTAQNLARIEADLWQMAPKVIYLPHEEATLICEHLVRAYDPCISCATHFLKLEVKEI